MVTTIYESRLGNGETDRPAECRGLSTDTKPTDLPNGSIFLEMNTGKVFMYDQTGATWREL